MVWNSNRPEKCDSVKPSIADLGHRLGESIRIFMTDHCYKDRAWLKQAFGDHVEVFQDTFHLIQRIIHAVNKSLPMGLRIVGKLRGLLKGMAT